MKRFNNILFVKSAGNNEAALDHAVTLAKLNRARLVLLATFETIPDLSRYGLPDEVHRDAMQLASESAVKELEQLVKQHGDDVQIELRVVEGIRFLEIIREVLRNGHDLVIKSAEGNSGLISRLFSTEGMHLLRKCPCPVWLVKPDCSETLKRIVAAVDFDEPGDDGENQALNRQIMEIAISLAHREKAELHVVHAWQAMAEQVLSSGRSGLPVSEVEEYILEIKTSRENLLNDLMNEAKGWVGPEMFEAVNPKTYAIKGRAHQVIARQTQEINADLLVMGTVGRTGIPGFLIGNTAENILNWIDCSVLAVKPAGFESPVKL